MSSRRSGGTVVELDGLRVLGPISTWISFAGMIGQDDLTAMADRLVGGTLTSRPLCSLADLDRGLEAAGALRGIRRLREARSNSRVGAWSRPETLLRLLIIRAGLPEPELNVAVRLDGGLLAYPDLSWPRYRIAIEYDGRWHDDSGRREIDAERHERFVDAGWLIVHVRARELFDRPSALLARLVRRLRERGYALTSSIDASQMVGPRR